MPITPYHIGPSACIALPLYKKIDIPAFLFADYFVDLQPFMVILLNLHSPMHGITHSLIGAALMGATWGLLAYGLKGFIMISVRYYLSLQQYYILISQ